MACLTSGALSARTQLSSHGRPRIAMHRQRVFVTRAATPDTSGGLLKRPELKRPEAPPKKLFEDDAGLTSTAPDASVSVASASTSAIAPTSVTIEYQRQRAKEMRAYFQERKLEQEIVKASRFGWTPLNEISNGRWVMFGFAVGMLTEYATGVDFINQLRLMVSYLGIADLE